MRVYFGPQPPLDCHKPPQRSTDVQYISFCLRIMRILKGKQKLKKKKRQAVYALRIPYTNMYIIFYAHYANEEIVVSNCFEVYGFLSETIIIYN